MAVWEGVWSWGGSSVGSVLLFGHWHLSHSKVSGFPLLSLLLVFQEVAQEEVACVGALVVVNYFHGGVLCLVFRAGTL